MGQMYPGVDLAYDLAIQSYALVQHRLDAVDSRIQTLQAFSATATFAAPVLAQALYPKIEFASQWFIAALAVFAAIVIVGAVARGWGSFQLIAPNRLYDGWLHSSPWEFKKDIVYFAGEHFKKNKALVNAKGWVAHVMTAGFLAEAVLLAAWVLSARP